MIVVGFPSAVFGAVFLRSYNSADQGGGIYNGPGPCYEVRPCKQNVAPALALGLGLPVLISGVTLLAYGVSREKKYHAWEKRQARLSMSWSSGPRAGIELRF